MEILFSRDEIARRVAALGSEITEFYYGKPLLCLAIIDGGMIFAADLVRVIALPLEFDSIGVASYKKNVSSGELDFRAVPKLDATGKHVLLIDEVLDTGLTLAKLKKMIGERGAASVRSVVAVEKNCPRAAGGLEHADWRGFEAPGRYLVGYGMDVDELYRNLPDIVGFDATFTENSPFK